MERWRVAFAIVAALAALPLLAIDNVSSADPGRSLAVSTDVPAVELLASRAGEWTHARESERREGLDEAIAVARMVKADEAAKAAAQQAEAEAAEARQAAAARDAEAERKAQATERAQRNRAAAETQRTTQARRPSLAPAVPPTAAPRSGDPTAAQWAALRDCESSGSYTIVSSNGRFRGAYQFDQATWDHVARRGPAHLVGVDPAAAAPADQDAVALALYRSRGTSPWPRCGSALR